MSRIILAVSLIWSLGSLRAAERAQLAGRVEDASGAVLVDARLAALNQESGIRRTGHTDETGAYVIGGLAPGIYKVTARKPGFQTVARLNVELTPDRETRLDFVMRVGSIREVITVEEGPKLLHLDDGAVGITAPRKLIDALPLGGRGVLSLVELAPGVIATPASHGEAGQFSSSGQRANANYFTVDGVSANTGVTGSVLPAQFPGGALPAMTAFGGMQNLAAIDALQEVRIQTSSFAPEFGRMPGAQVTLITRSGSNQWHGVASYGVRHEELAANDWFAAGRGYGRSPLRLNRWGGALGGAVRRDRTFFFAALEGLRLRAPFAWLAATPSPASRRAASAGLQPLLDAFPLPNGRDLGGGLGEFLARGSRPSRLDSGSLRIDHALTPRIALFGRFNQAPSSTEFGYSPVEQAEFQSRSITVGTTAISGASLTNDARFNISADSVVARWRPNHSGIDLAGFLPDVPRSANPLYGVAIGGVGQLLSGQSGVNRQGQLELVETLAWNQGGHALRLGADYNRLTPARVSNALAVAGVWRSLAALLSGTPIETAISQAEQASSLIEILSFYCLDTWRPTSRLALTYGLRWEITPAPSIRQNALAAPPAIPSLPPGPVAAPPGSGPLWPTRYDQLAPRLGVAWRLSDRSVLRAGWGIFYDLGFSAATDPINGFPYNRWQFGLNAGTFPAITPLLGSGFGANLRLPRSFEWNLSYERALSASDVLAVSYVGSAGRRLLRREAALLTESGIARGATATNHGASDSHALETEYRRRLARGFEGIASYTWAHTLDNGSWDSAVALAGSAAGDRGSSSFDIRHAWSAGLSYESPGLHPLFADWNLQGILRARTGFPIEVLANENLLGFGLDDFPRPDAVPGAPLWTAGRLNPGAFAAPTGLRQGTLGRNAIAGFGMFQVDLALRRRFPLGEAASLELGVESFNALNHPNLADPVRYLSSPFFGQPVSMLSLMLGAGSPRSGLTPAFQVGGPRSVEVAVKLRF